MQTSWILFLPLESIEILFKELVNSAELNLKTLFSLHWTAIKFYVQLLQSSSHSFLLGCMNHPLHVNFRIQPRICVEFRSRIFCYPLCGSLHSSITPITSKPFWHPHFCPLTSQASKTVSSCLVSDHPMPCTLNSALRRKAT